LGVSEKTHFFGVDNQDIAVGFDPPYPHKCTCNRFLKHAVTNVLLDIVVNGQRLSVSAQWAARVCEIDNQSVLYHLLLDVTDRYLKPFAHEATNFILAV
jgi:hypothetical protein